ncbi:unnamed protein product [Cyclocybe aegerita]|uniref:Uncharacterized protein n=1 Tax=Cyclocybe aegerita TaxID=1973307 RepID=A0A8S0VWD7_CYCAE|nr:unnamed protein product [Cyclocybe aegerita]
MSVSIPADIDVSLPLSTSVVDADYTPDTVPGFIKDKVIENGVLFVDVVNAGAKVGTALEDHEATDCGLIKNHWTFRAHLDFGQDGRDDLGQVKFGMDIKRSVSIGSNEGQYARSNRSDPDTGSDMVYSPVGSFSKPPAPSSDDGFPAALPLVPATGEGSHDSHDSQSAGVSDVESVGKLPDITSSDGLLFQQPTEGAPHPGDFNIKVRSRTEPSRSVVVVFELALAPGTTFGQLLKALIDRNMLPFFFRKIGAQATAAWLRKAFFVSGEAVMVLSDPNAEGDIVIDDNHIFSLLGWRYTNPLIPINVPSVPGTVALTRRGVARSRNLIDRAVWPANFVHVEDEKLKYNQHITQEDTTKDPSERIDTVCFSAPREEQWPAVDGLSPIHLEVQANVDESIDLSPLDKFKHLWTALRTFRMGSVCSFEEWPALITAQAESIDLGCSHAIHWTSSGGFQNLKRLEIEENNAIDMFLFAMKEIPGLLGRLEVLHLQSTIGCDL